jgi:predicted CoA-substrate-specific enzyme activase
MKTAGIDIGSRTVKLVIHNGDEVVHSEVRENSFNTLEVCNSLINGHHFDNITATGYGRHLFAEKHSVPVISEIKAFAKGIHHIYPQVRTILDIGGQDTKAISIDEKGNLLKFEMNDKCAAGTGRFFEIMAMALRYSLDELGQETLAAEGAVSLNSMCTVFAESEVISVLAKGADRREVARGVHQSIVKRALSLLRRVGIRDGVAFVGGVARNPAMRRLLENELKRPLIVPDNPQIVGALGCAIAGRKQD